MSSLLLWFIPFLGLLRDVNKPDILLKPLVEKELKFYQFLQSAITAQEVARIRDFVPQFHGILQLRNPLHSGLYTRISCQAVTFPD